MKTKLEMAHEWAIELLRSGYHSDDIISCAWQYAEAMQAEADKRINKDRPDALLTKDKDGNCLHFHHEFGHKKCMDCGASLEEWQPDWSKAPATADIWKKSSADNYYWYCGDTCLGKAPSFDYQGDWRDSLRKRPN